MSIAPSEIVQGSNKMYKCACGNQIPLEELDYRTVHGDRQYTIKNVPSYACDHCGTVTISRINRVKIKKLISEMEKDHKFVSDFKAL